MKTPRMVSSQVSGDGVWQKDREGKLLTRKVPQLIHQSKGEAVSCFTGSNPVNAGAGPSRRTMAITVWKRHTVGISLSVVSPNLRIVLGSLHAAGA